jgi:hypothetical protein
MTFDPVLLDAIAKVFAEAAVRALESHLRTQKAILGYQLDDHEQDSMEEIEHRLSKARSDLQACSAEQDVGNYSNHCDAPIRKGDGTELPEFKLKLARTLKWT